MIDARAAMRAATLLGPNTVDGLQQVVAHLNRCGHKIEIVSMNAGAVNVGSDADAHGNLGVDLLWACGLLTVQMVAAGADLDVVAAPVFTGESDAVYRSAIVARSTDPGPGRRLAINEYGSWSGYRALFHDAAVRAEDRWHPDHMEAIVVTGAHVESVAAVADGRADIAAIDSSVWNWLIGTDPVAVDGLRVVDRTVECPAPPLSLVSPTSLPDADRLIDDLVGFAGVPPLVPASVESYEFMAGAGT